MLRGSQDHLEVIEPLGMGKQHEDNAPDCPHTKFAVKRDKLTVRDPYPTAPNTLAKTMKITSTPAAIANSDW